MQTHIHLDGTIADAYYLQLPTGGATQGDIWINLPAGPDGTSGCDGVIITPRCDFAHCKSPVINYLPIVSLEQYLLTIGCFSLIEQYISDTHDLLRSKSRFLGIETLFELGVPVAEILHTVGGLIHSGDERSTKRFNSAKDEFANIASKLTVARQLLLEDNLTMDQVRCIASAKRFDRLQRDLIRNNAIDTYFIPPCSNLIASPSIILLRHIYTCPIEYINYTGSLSLDKRDSSAPGLPERLLRINSPFIESLMAKLAALFTRVGTRDIPEAAAVSFALPYAEDIL